MYCGANSNIRIRFDVNWIYKNCVVKNVCQLLRIASTTNFLQRILMTQLDIKIRFTISKNTEEGRLRDCMNRSAVV